jgi:hypothetical protein
MVPGTTTDDMHVTIVAKIPRHLENCHGDEVEVVRSLALSDKQKRSREMERI